jgi:hypothetical protein
MKVSAIKFAMSIKVGKRGDQIESVVDSDICHHTCDYDPKDRTFTIVDKRDPTNCCKVFQTNVAWYVPNDEGN